MKKTVSFRESMTYALSGIATVFRRERNLRIDAVIGLAVLAAAFCFRVTRTEWLILIMTVTGVMAAEVMNSAVEYLTDLSTGGTYHPLAKAAKDAAAGAVLVTAAGALLVGAVIFGPRLLGW